MRCVRNKKKNVWCIENNSNTLKYKFHHSNSCSPNKFKRDRNFNNSNRTACTQKFVHVTYECNAWGSFNSRALTAHNEAKKCICLSNFFCQCVQRPKVDFVGLVCNSICFWRGIALIESVYYNVYLIFELWYEGQQENCLMTIYEIANDCKNGEKNCRTISKNIHHSEKRSNGLKYSYQLI